MSRFPSGVTVVTTHDTEGRFYGITVSAFSSLSLEPPRVLICVEKTTGSHAALETSGAFIVNILSDSQRELSERFASQVEDKFESVYDIPVAWLSLTAVPWLFLISGLACLAVGALVARTGGAAPLVAMLALGFAIAAGPVAFGALGKSSSCGRPKAPSRRSRCPPVP